MKKFLFRCDCSSELGLGHLHRCLTLADELKRQGAMVYFLCRSRDIDLNNILNPLVSAWSLLDWEITAEEDIEAIRRHYSQWKIDVAVIDHYQTNEHYQKRLFELGVCWLQFDGLAQKHFWADWVFNASPLADKDVYHSLKRRPDTQFLLGPAYALLREEFRTELNHVCFQKRVKKILMTFGGGDDRGCTKFCLEATKNIDPEIERVVVVGRANPHSKEIHQWIKKHPRIRATFLNGTTQMARYMAESDIALIAGGTTTYETVAMGLSSLMIQLADNQAPNLKAWEREGVAFNMGPLENLDPKRLEAEIKLFIDMPSRRKIMFQAGRKLIDGYGAQRVANILMSGKDMQ